MRALALMLACTGLLCLSPLLLLAVEPLLYRFVVSRRLAPEQLEEYRRRSRHGRRPRDLVIAMGIIGAGALCLALRMCAG